MAGADKETEEVPALLSKGLGEMSQQKYRILRIIEYTGEREWIDEQINKRREAILGETAEIIDPTEQPLKEQLNVR